MKLTEKINFRQPKYQLPAILYIPLVILGFFVCRFFVLKPTETGDSRLVTKDELNTSLPEANIKGDGVGRKYENMLKNYGRIKDETAVEIIEREEQEKESYESRYTDAEVAAIEQQSEEAREANEKLKQLQETVRESQRREESLGVMADRSGGNTEEEDETLADLRQALEAARQQANAVNDASGTYTGQVKPSFVPVKPVVDSVKVEEPPHNENAVTELADDAVSEEVVKTVVETSDYFNTITTNEPEHKLVKAIIDEEIKAVSGSRVRLRLLDDIEIGSRTIPSGSYLYATMSSFSQQRVKGSVKSILYDDELVKVNLSIYDTDGMEGLYVPNSHFRETAKDVMGGAFSGGNTLLGTETGTDNIARWGRQVLTNAYSRTSSAIAKAIKKNSVKLKYGTHVYLINSRDKKIEEK